MDIPVADWVLQTTTTVGTGTITLSLPAPGYTDLQDALKASGDVWYSLLSSTGDRECGIGYFDYDTNTLQRTTIHATLKNGKHSSISPTPIELKGQSLVSCTFNAESWKQFITEVQVGNAYSLPSTSDPEVTNTGTHSVPVLNFGIPKGDKGDAATIEIASTVTGNPGTPAGVTNEGDAHNAVLKFTIPGSVEVSVGSTTTLDPGSQATVVDGNTDLDKVVLNFGIPRGEPGLNGTGVVVETLAALRGVVGTTPNETVTMLGYRTANDGGDGLWVWKSFSGTLADAVYDNGGTYAKPTGYSGSFRWERVGAFSEPSNPLWWGAYRDNTNAEATTAAIQSAVDWTLYRFGALNTEAGIVSATGGVLVPHGRYAISDTIHLGYGGTDAQNQSYKSITFAGEGMAFPYITASRQFCGTVLIPTFNDRPAISVQGGRNVVVQDLGLLGLNAAWLVDNRLGGSDSTTNPRTLDDLDITNWVNPAFPASASSRYAPYAAIAIDPYSGVKPATAYPDVAFPSWSGITTQYRKGATSNTLIRNVHIDGFVVGVVNKPSADHDQCDFTKLDRVTITECQYGFSVGNNQARLCQLNNVAMSRVHTCITTGAHGMQNGKNHIQANSCQFAACIRWVDLVLADYGGAVTFTNCYGELIYSIGRVTSNGSTDFTAIFQNCDFAFSASWAERGAPTAVFERTGVQGSAVFDACTFSVSHYWLGLTFKGGKRIGVRNSMVNYASGPPWLDGKDTNGDGVLDTYLQASAIHYAVKATKGFVFVADTTSQGFPAFFENNRCSFEQQAWWTKLPTFCLWEKQTPDAFSLAGSGVPVRWKYRQTQKSTLGMSSVAGRVYRINVTDASVASLHSRTFMPGDILVDGNTGIPFLITATEIGTPNVLTLLAMSGYDKNSVVRQTNDVNGNAPLSLTAGYFYGIPGRLACADLAVGAVIYATTALDSNVVTGVRSDNAVGTWSGVTNWAAGTTYYAGDRVLTDGSYYYCLGFHVAASTFATDQTAGFWSAMPALAEQSAWNGHITVGDYVQCDSEIEITVPAVNAGITAVTATTFTTTGNWTSSATRRRLPFFIKKAPPNITDPRLP